MQNTDMAGMIPCIYLGISPFILTLILFAVYFIGSIPFGPILTKIFDFIGAKNVLARRNKILAIPALLLDVAKGIAAIFLLNHIHPTGTELEYMDITGSWPHSVITFLRSDSYHEIISFIDKHTAINRYKNFDSYEIRHIIACKNAENIVIMLTAFFAILGHCFPIFLGFKGGKGMAITLGIFLFAAPYAGIMACLTWLFTALLSRNSSLPSLLAIFVATLAIFILYGVSAGYACLPITALIFYRHKENIKRLINGTEPKIGEKKDAAPKA